MEAQEPLWLVMPLHLLGFFVAALVCHGELARDRPGTASLTSFYLLIALGGALGGLVTGIVVPALVDSVPEYALALILACFCLPKKPPRIEPGPFARRLDFLLPLALGALVALVLSLVELGGEDLEGAGLSFAFGLGAGVALNFVRRPLRFGLSVAAITLAAALVAIGEAPELHQERSFFGVYRVTATERRRDAQPGARHDRPRRPGHAARAPPRAAHLLPLQRPGRPAAGGHAARTDTRASR